jgi:hypothetical protein
MGKDKENQGDFSKSLKSCENPGSPAKFFFSCIFQALSANHGTLNVAPLRMIHMDHFSPSGQPCESFDSRAT